MKSIFGFIDNLVSNVYNQLQRLIFKFLPFVSHQQILYGTSTPRARWRDCTSYVNTNFGLATGRLFVKESFHESAKNDVSFR